MLMQRNKDPDSLSRLGSTLAALASTATSEQSRSQLLVRLASARTVVDCKVAIAHTTREDLNLLVDMVKWPVCGASRNSVMLHIAELERQDARIFGEYIDGNNTLTFRSDVRKFVKCLGAQRDAQRRPFDIEGSPRHNPLATKSVS